MRAWDDWVVELLRAGADLDLRIDGEATPRFVAAEGDEPVFFAEIRPFAKGGYHRPLIELMALALPLGADRVAVGITGRLSSLEDPIPPVIDGVGDLRQRALVLELVDGHGQRATNRSVITPFDLLDGDVVWGEPFEPGPAEGWISQALTVMVDERDRVRMTEEDVRFQMDRCLALGHDISLEDEVADRFGIGSAPLG